MMERLQWAIYDIYMSLSYFVKAFIHPAYSVIVFILTLIILPVLMGLTAVFLMLHLLVKLIKHLYRKAKS